MQELGLLLRIDRALLCSGYITSLLQTIFQFFQGGGIQRSSHQNRFNQLQHSLLDKSPYFKYLGGIKRVPKVASILAFLRLLRLNVDWLERSFRLLKRRRFLSLCFFEGRSLLTNAGISADQEKGTQGLDSVENSPFTHY